MAGFVKRSNALLLDFSGWYGGLHSLCKASKALMSENEETYPLDFNSPALRMYCNKR